MRSSDRRRVAPAPSVPTERSIERGLELDFGKFLCLIEGAPKPSFSAPTLRLLEKIVHATNDSSTAERTPSNCR